MNEINEMKLKVLMDIEADHIIDPEEDFFELGLLMVHRLIDENFQLTAEGEKVYREHVKHQFYQFKQ